MIEIRLQSEKLRFGDGGSSGKNTLTATTALIAVSTIIDRLARQRPGGIINEA
jgi:hypothetical protein